MEYLYHYLSQRQSYHSVSNITIGLDRDERMPPVVMIYIKDVAQVLYFIVVIKGFTQ